jgi:hypothetical protein
MHRGFCHCGREALVPEPAPRGSGWEAAAAPDAGFGEITRAPAVARTQVLSAMMRMIARLNAVALNSAARPKMMLAAPKATAV